MKSPFEGAGVILAAGGALAMYTHTTDSANIFSIPGKILSANPFLTFTSWYAFSNRVSCKDGCFHDDDAMTNNQIITNIGIAIVWGATTFNALYKHASKPLTVLTYTAIAAGLYLCKTAHDNIVKMHSRDTF